MKIGIIGAGTMGSRLGKLWAAKGHQVMFGSRDAAKAKAQAVEVGGGTQGGTYTETAAFGECVLIGVPWSGALAAVRSLGALAGKTLIDITNPIGENVNNAIGYTTSAAEEIARVAAGAHVVKAFNAISYLTLDRPLFGGLKADVYYCGDQGDAQTVVARLIADAGLEPVDAGPLRNARLLESLANLWLQLASIQRGHPEMAFKLLRRG